MYTGALLLSPAKASRPAEAPTLGEEMKPLNKEHSVVLYTEDYGAIPLVAGPGLFARGGTQTVHFLRVKEYYFSSMQAKKAVRLCRVLTSRDYLFPQSVGRRRAIV